MGITCTTERQCGAVEKVTVFHFPDLPPPQCGPWAKPLTHNLPSLLHPLNRTSISQAVVLSVIRKHEHAHKHREPYPCPLQSESIKPSSTPGE